MSFCASIAIKWHCSASQCHFLIFANFFQKLPPPANPHEHWLRGLFHHFPPTSKNAEGVGFEPTFLPTESGTKWRVGASFVPLPLADGGGGGALHVLGRVGVHE
jgi:hypothetical protein